MLLLKARDTAARFCSPFSSFGEARLSKVAMSLRSDQAYQIFTVSSANPAAKQLSGAFANANAKHASGNLWDFISFNYPLLDPPIP
jgi:hypothetical protein